MKYCLKVLSLLIFPVTFVSCNFLSGPDSGSLSLINGQIENWNHGNNYMAYFKESGGFEVYDSSKIDNQGYFEFKSIAYPHDSTLFNPVYLQFADDANILQNTLVCSDSTARKVDAIIAVRRASDSEFLSYLYKKNFTYSFYFDEDLVKPGDVMVEYVYVNKEVSLKGTVEWKHSHDYAPQKGHFKRNYDLNFKKGWNVQTIIVQDQEVIQYGDTTFTRYEYDYVAYEPTETKWYTR